MRGILAPLARAYDYVTNRALGTFVGLSPRQPRQLIIPSFVVIRESAPSIAGLIAQMVDARALRRPLIVADPQTWRIAGARLSQELLELGFRSAHEVVIGNSLREVDKVVSRSVLGATFSAQEPRAVEARIHGPKKFSIVVAVGGGSVIDVAKLASRRLNLPCVVVPTALSNDGIASPFAVIAPEPTPGGPAQLTVPTNTPFGVVVLLTNLRCPDAGHDGFLRTATISGIGDAVSNITACLDWELAARRGRDTVDYLAALHARSAGEVILSRLARGEAPESPEFLLTLAAALVSSGEAMTRVGSSRPASGFEHKLYHAFHNLLRFPSQATHGVLVAIGTLVSAVAHGQWEEPIRRAFVTCGLPVDAAGLAAVGVRPAEVETAIRASGQIKPERYTIVEEAGAERLVEAFRRAYGLGA